MLCLVLYGFGNNLSLIMEHGTANVWIAPFMIDLQLWATSLVITWKHGNHGMLSLLAEKTNKTDPEIFFRVALTPDNQVHRNEQVCNSFSFIPCFLLQHRCIYFSWKHFLDAHIVKKPSLLVIVTSNTIVLFPFLVFHWIQFLILVAWTHECAINF